MAAAYQRPRNRGKIKITRKELKAPDEFLTLTESVLSFARHHLRLVSLALGGIAACSVIAWAALTYVHGIEREAFAQLWQIEAQIHAAPAGEPMPAGVIEQLQRITQEIGAGEAQRYAWLYLGHAYYRQGDDAAAAVAYQQVLERTERGSLLWSLAELGRGYAFEAAGELPRAQEAYQQVIDTDVAGLALEAYLGKARVAERRNDVDTTVAAYSAVAERFPAIAESLGITEKLEALKAHKS